MNQIYINALIMLDNRIKSCGKALSKVNDANSIDYWQKQLALAQLKKRNVMKRSKLQHNVIFVDFQARRKVA